VDLSQADYGVALFNDCKYGFRIKGHVIDMNLLRSVPHPGSPLIGKDNKADTSAAAVYGDLGAHTFTYALQPHAGPANLAKLTAAARALNTPLTIVESRAPAAPLTNPDTSHAPSFSIDSDSIELAAIKPADDGQGWALRLINVEDRSITAPFSAGTWTECDLMERALPDIASQSSTKASLAFQPFEIKSLRLG
jgi:alpha-mannosidase